MKKTIVQALFIYNCIVLLLYFNFHQCMSLFLGPISYSIGLFVIFTVTLLFFPPRLK